MLGCIDYRKSAISDSQRRGHEFFQLPAPTTYEEQIQRNVDGDRLFSGTHFEFDEEADYKKRANMRARSDDTKGGMRHSLMFGSGDPQTKYQNHKANLAKLDLPVMVIAGGVDQHITLALVEVIKGHCVLVRLKTRLGREGLGVARDV